MILSTLNGIAVMLARTPDAAMSIPEQLMIQPPLTAILARPSVVQRVSRNAPYAALVIGFAMWGSRVAQMRQSANVPPVARDTGVTAAADESNNHTEMPDNGPVWDQLQTIRVG